MYCVDLGESFQMSIYLQNVACVHPRTIPVKFARSQCTDPGLSSLLSLEGGWLLGTIFGHFFMIFKYFMIFFLVSFKENEIITGLSVFLSVKRRRLPCVVADDDDV